MQSVREDIDKDHQEIENGEVIIFFQVARFVTSFQYHKFLSLMVINNFMELKSLFLFGVLHTFILY